MARELEVITEHLGPASTTENIMVLKFSADLITELAGMVEGKHLFDAILIDVTQCGFLFTAEMLIEAAQLAKNLLQLRGSMVFLKSDKAVAIMRDSLTGNLSFHVFNNHSELFDHSPSLARKIKETLGKSFELEDQNTDLSQQILMAAIPILTSLGIKLKATLESNRRRNMVLSCIDNYTPLNTITHRLCDQERLTISELMEELKSLEQAKAIYPLFPKINFLVSCFKNRAKFGLKDYLIGGKLLTHEQADDLLTEIHNMPPKERLSLGPLAVKKGFINGRQLVVALQDQDFYGHGGEESQEAKKLVKRIADSTQVDALVGHLGTTDPSNLLQNFVQNRQTGVLSVENKDNSFKAHFDIGKITHAKLGKLEGNKAIVEFASSWEEGMFVFMQRVSPADLSRDSCKLTRVLDKLLLDSALARDNMDVVLKKLPKGVFSVLEKLPDDEGLLTAGKFEDPKEKTPIKPDEVKAMMRVWNALDGLTPLKNVVHNLGDVTTSEASRAVDLLLHYNLVSIHSADVSQPLATFQVLLKKVTDTVGKEKSSAFLRLSLRDTVGYSGHARVYVMTPSCEVGIDMVAARATGASLTTIVKDLENWQVKFIEYVSQDIDPETLMSIIREVHPHV